MTEPTTAAGRDLLRRAHVAGNASIKYVAEAIPRIEEEAAAEARGSLDDGPGLWVTEDALRKAVEDERGNEPDPDFALILYRRLENP